MPARKLTTLPDASERWKHVPPGMYAGCQLGEFDIAYVTVPVAMDCTDHYKHAGMPGGVCPCAHYGYVFEGRMRCTYPGSDKTDEVAEAGDVYYWPAGHVLVYEAPTTCFELNPAAAFVDYMDYGARAAARDAEKVASEG